MSGSLIAAGMSFKANVFYNIRKANILVAQAKRSEKSSSEVSENIHFIAARSKEFCALFELRLLVEARAGCYIFLLRGRDYFHPI